MHLGLNVQSVSFEDYQRRAKSRLPRQLYDYIVGGSGNEHTVAHNRQALNAIQLLPRVLRDVAAVNSGCELLGDSFNLPLALSPVGLAGLFHTRAEKVAAACCHSFNIPFTLSTVGLCSIEEVVSSGSEHVWFQLYVMKQRQHTEYLLQRAQDAGCNTLVVTLDMPVLAERRRDFRNGLQSNTWYARWRRALDFVGHPGWLWRVAMRGSPLTFGNLSALLPDARSLDDFKAWIDEQFDPALTWEMLDWLRARWPGKLILKGIMHPQDALMAKEAGADALIISNHGGRQLDSAPAAIEVLPAIRHTLGEDFPLIIDGGIYSGIELFKGIAAGANMAMMGRPWVMALAAAGEQGLSRFLQRVQTDFVHCMQLCGVTEVDAVDESLIFNAADSSRVYS